jgi:hypothetical protein
MRAWILLVIKKGSKRLRTVSKPQPFFRVFLNFALGLLVLDLGSLTKVMKKRKGLLTGAFCRQLHFYHLLGHLVRHLTPILTLKFPQPCPNRKVLWGGPTSENDREKLKEQDRMDAEILGAKLQNDRVCLGNSALHFRTMRGSYDGSRNRLGFWTC